jgi:hypothetical protein
MRNVAPPGLLTFSVLFTGVLVWGCMTAQGRLEPRGESTTSLDRSCQTDDWTRDCSPGCHLEQVSSCFCSSDDHLAGLCFDCPAPGYECVADIPTPDPDSGAAPDAGLDLDVTDASAPTTVDGAP